MQLRLPLVILGHCPSGRASTGRGFRRLIVHTKSHQIVSRVHEEGLVSRRICANFE